MNTELVDSTNLTKNEIYNFWHDNLTMSDMPNTQTQPSIYLIDVQQTSYGINLGRIERTAKAWGEIPLHLSDIFKSRGQQTVGDFSACLPVLDKDITDFCIMKNVFADAILYYNTIRKTFYNMKSIGISLESDPELEDIKKIRFDVTLADSIENIFGMEGAFNKAVRGLISMDSSAYFVLTANTL